MAGRRFLIPLIVIVVVGGGLAVASWWAGTGRGGGALVRAGEVPSCGAAWRIVESPNPSGAYNNLSGIVALSPQDIWAVGVSGKTEEFARTMMLHWDGTQWTHVPSPSAEGYSNHVHAVAAASPDEVWAVGAYHKDADYWQTLAMRWDGTEWAMAPSPNAGPISILNGVAVAAGDVWAVGEYSAGGGLMRPLIMRRQGGEWRIVPVAVSRGTLNGVVAFAPDDVWAVGSSADLSGSTLKPLVMHWDGQEWAVEESPGAGELWAISGNAEGEVWAVGNNGGQTLVMRREGTRWEVVPSPSPSREGNSLSGVAVAGGEVWAVGSQSVEGRERPLAMRWDGHEWTVSASLTKDTELEALYAVAALGGEAWAVGSYIANPFGTNLTLVQRYSDPCR